MPDRPWMIYGAYGFSGELIAREAKRRGKRPVLAGRNKARLSELAEELGFPFKVFALDDPEFVTRQLNGMFLVLHCAGPFSATASPMIEACLKSGTHYLDITGEIEVLEHAHRQNRSAAGAGVVICPAVGFDVIPTDCLAAALKAAMPDAIRLALGFESSIGLSPGTAKSSLEGIGKGGKVRRNGVIETVSLNYKTRKIDFGNGEKEAMTIPWGDVSTAYYTTGIANVEVYIPIPPGTRPFKGLAPLLRPVLAVPLIQNFFKKLIEKRVQAPDESVREKERTYIWGEVANPEGKKKTARVTTAEGYELTVHGSLEIVKKILSAPPAGGSYTPSQIMGNYFVSTLPRCSEIVIE